ncbi:hypothetical protein [Pedobacter metabolipauper]|uniref:Uncharacterized protein n=1 Tax=Pedobacter metabolipauper TaxID=425513 RepID=A0A4R6T0U0_9SPHI|nr:hypothetical protein [Pedobacter metabolipauper]TDQ11090.1 hypothetical protein ATK78_0204 [Pedobacter metabolipauper]
MNYGIGDGIRWAYTRQHYITASVVVKYGFNRAIAEQDPNETRRRQQEDSNKIASVPEAESNSSRTLTIQYGDKKWV